MSVGEMRRACQSRGRASVGWLIGLLVAALAIGVAVSKINIDPGAPSNSPAQPAPETPAPQSEPLATDTEVRAPAIERPTPPAGQREDFEKAFTGQAVIRGQVQVAEGHEFPERWELVLEPSRYLEGSEKAVYRSVTMTGGTRNFEVTDLPLGGYDVSAQAPGLNGIPVSVLLYTIAGRPDLPGARSSYLNLHMTPAGFVDGSVVDQHGTPVGDLPVTLTNPVTHGTLSTVTDPAGNYLFPVVLDGEYEIAFGDPDRPLREAEWFTFMAPSMRYPERKVPAFVDLTFRVYDERGHPVPDAAIRGYGDPSGTLDLVSDSQGQAIARFLSPGRYRVKAKERSGEIGKVDFEVFPADREKLVEIVTKP